MSTGRQMDKEVVVHIQQNITQLLKKNVFESLLVRWMKPVLIIQSEVSQKEKHQYCILTLIYGI